MKNPPQNRKKICRLCLIKCDNFEVIVKDAKDDLDLLLPKMNLFVSDDLIICKNCAEIVKKCFVFKRICLGTHNCILSFTNESNTKIDLKKVYLSMKENIIDIPEDYNVCGFCMNLVKYCSAICLDNEDGDNTLHKTMLPKFLPELDLSIIEKPKICAPCHESLNDYFQFVTNCLTVEQKIKKYCESQNITSDNHLIDLTDVLQFTLGNISTSKKDDNIVDIVKKEIFLVDSENIDELIEDRNKNFMETDDQKFENGLCTSKTVWIREEKSKIADVIKTEEEFYAEQTNEVAEENEHVKMEDQKFVHKEDFEIKINQQDFNRFQNGVVEPDGNPTSAHEHSSQRDPLEIPIHQCDVCLYQAKDKWTLETHNLMHEDTTEITLYQCESCFYQTKHQDNLKNHKLTHTKTSKTTSYQCAFCTFETKHKRSLRDHLLLHKPPSEITMFQCELCPFKAKYKKSILKHTRRTHKDESQMEMYRCETCSFQTKYKESIKRHSLIHMEPSEVLMYQCDACSFQTRHKNGLKMHILIHRDTSEVQMFHCDSCSYQTKKKFALKMHSLIHKDCSQVIMYQCDVCQYQAKRKYALEKHRLIHKDSSQVTMYKCDCCSYMTKHKRCLKRHILIHKDPSEIPMYQCESCSYQTKFKADISRHLMTHKTNQK